jgi:hypothetical protein
LALAWGAGPALAQTQNLPEPSPANTLITNAQCGTQGEAAMGFEQLHTTGSRNTFESHFTQWISGNNSNTALPTNWTYRTQDSSIFADGNTPDIRSEKTFQNFELRLSYRNSGNDGIFYKMLTRGSFAWSVGVEFGIDNNTSQANRKITAGAAYDIFEPAPPASQWYNSYASGKWNQVRIVSKGDSVEHWVNNIKVVGYRYWNARWNSAVAASKWNNSNDFAQNTAGCRCMVVNGFVGFQGDHDGDWHLRNIRLTSDTAHIKFGPANCVVTDVRAERASEKQNYSLERLPGSLRLQLLEETASKAEVLGLDGRIAADVILQEKGQSLLVRKWKSPGIYLIRVTLTHGAVRNIKVFLS